MDPSLGISALMLAVIGLSLTLFAIMTALRIALKAKKEKSVPDGLYRVRKVGKDGLDSIFELEEVSKEAKGEPKEEAKTGRPGDKKAQS